MILKEIFIEFIPWIVKIFRDVFQNHLPLIILRGDLNQKQAFNEVFFYNPNPKLYIGCDQSWKNVPYTVVSGWVLTDGEITKLSDGSIFLRSK